MSFDAETLYRLLPAVYRVRDAEQGGVLRELMEVIAGQAQEMEADLEQLYDDQFIETCADWVVPYIGDLLGYRDLFPVAAATGIGSPRAEVANTIAHRRSKGTARQLEQLARDVTGWDAVVVELFRRLATTQSLIHLRPQHRPFPDLRSWQVAADLGGAFDRLPHTLDVRRMAAGGVRHNIPNIGIFLWRIRSFPFREVRPAPVDRGTRLRYRFDPLGLDTPLYARPQTETALAQATGPDELPLPLSRPRLRAGLARHYGAGASLWVYRDGQLVPPGQVRVCDLSDLDDGSGGWANMPADGIAVDPELGRLALSPALRTWTTRVRVGFHYGFSAEMGGGVYDRSAALAGSPDVRVPVDHATLSAALPAAADGGVVEIQDNGRYARPYRILLRQDRALVLRGRNGRRPTVLMRRALRIGGHAGGELTLDGLAFRGGQLRVLDSILSRPNRLRRLTLRHCTLVPGSARLYDDDPLPPGRPSLYVTADTELLIDRCILGGLEVEGQGRVVIRDSILDAGAAEAAACRVAGHLEVRRSTLIGTARAGVLELAENCLFLGTVRSDRVQQGCVRFSYLPLDSRVPRRYRCQPEPDAVPAPAPRFTSLRYGDAGYCQLGRDCPPQIREGADDESEMGAFHHLYEARREANLRLRLDEYLRFGLEAGIIFES
jgi:hypothetical protein